MRLRISSHLSAVTAMVMAATVNLLLVTTPAHAQSTQVDPSLCGDCAADLGGDPLVDISVRYLDAWVEWGAAAPTALLCTTTVDTSYQFIAVPSIALAPVGSTCLAKDGTIAAPSAATVGPPSVAPTPPSIPPVAGPAIPAPVQDVVIELPPVTSVPPVQAAQPPQAAPPQSHSSSSSRSKPAPSTNVAPAPSRIVGQAQVTPGVIAPGGPVTESQPDSALAVVPAPVLPDPPLIAQPAQALADVTDSTINVVLLGYVPTDYDSEDSMYDFVRQPDTLLVGTLLLELQRTDGTIVALAGSSLTFSLLPQEAALLAQDGDPGAATVSTFDTVLGGMRPIPALVVVSDDGSASISLSA